MPSPFSTFGRELCQHDDYRVGCLSCRAHDKRGELKEALEEKEKHEAAVERYHTRMDESDLSATEREKLEKAKAQHVECDERCQGVKEELASIEEEVKDVCARTNSDALAEAFENMAIESEFVPENPKREPSSKDLDLSNNPPTPDAPVSDREQADKSFESVTRPVRSAEREQQVASIVAQLSEWKAPEGFDDGSSNHPDPRQYYRGPPLALLDLQKLGIDPENLGTETETPERQALPTNH